MISDADLLREIHTLGEEHLRSAGTFWRRVYQDKALVAAWFRGDGQTAAQRTYEMWLTGRLVSPHTTPAHPRQVWTPVILRKSDSLTAAPFTPRLGTGAVIGPQPADSDYEEGEVLRIGTATPKYGCVGYPLASDVVAGPVYLFDSFSDPQAVLVQGVHYYVVPGGVAFNKSDDPFESGKFPLRTLPDGDLETVVWLASTATKQNLPADHFGWALGLPPSAALDQVRALWRLAHQSPASVNQFLVAVHSMLRAPCAQKSGTVVAVVQSGTDMVVVTDCEAIRVAAGYTLLPEVIVGYSVTPGLPIVNGLVYSRGGGVSRMTYPVMSASTFYGRVQVLQLTERLVGDSTSHILLARNEAVPITYHGVSEEGHTQLKFDLGPNSEPYWAALWLRMTADDNMATMLADWLPVPPPYHEDGATVGSINPLDFVLTVLGSNTDVLVVDERELGGYGMTRASLRHIQRFHPAHRQLLIIAATDLADTVDLEQAGDTVTVGAAAAITDNHSVASTAEEISIRWKPNCPA